MQMFIEEAWFSTISPINWRFFSDKCNKLIILRIMKHSKKLKGQDEEVAYLFMLVSLEKTIQLVLKAFKIIH